MFVTTSITWDVESNEVLDRQGYEYSGPLELCLGWGGASGAETDAATQDKQFSDALKNQQATEFSGEQDALNTVSSALEPIAKAGQYQYGFSTAENNALTGNIENAGAQATQNTENAALLREQQASGGAQTMPTGGEAALNAQVAATGAQKTAEQLGQEKELGYQVGRENFGAATKGLEDVASLENPTAGANATSNANQVTNSANQIVQQANANSMGEKMLGGLFNAGLGLATGGISTAMGAGGVGSWASKSALPTTPPPGSGNIGSLQGE